MSVSVQPTSLQFPKSGGQAELTFTNGSSKRKALMVRATNFIHLVIAPYYALVEPGASVKIAVTRHPNATRDDEILIAHQEAPAGVASAERVFEGRKEVEGELSVPVKIIK